ncbi:MAG TPA: histidine kinase, partial [Flavisolibacter sp.]|nr:histidine kinase [Flavisolibacter sp.]
MSGLVIFFLFALLILYINLGSVEVPFLAPAAFFREGIFIMFQMIASLYFVHYTIGWNNKRHQGHLNSSRRFLEEISFIVVIGFAITQLFHFLFVYITVKPEPDVETLSRRLRQLQMVSITFLLIIYAVMTTYRIFRSLQRKNLEVVKWEKEFAQAQFEVLKNQLNPHFLFNSLSALTTLVHKNAFVAEEFIGQLSKTYRYLLEQKDKHLVALKQEIDFLKNYLFLARQRYGTKLSVEI